MTRQSVVKFEITQPGLRRVDSVSHRGKDGSLDGAAGGGVGGGDELPGRVVN